MRKQVREPRTRGRGRLLEFVPQERERGREEVRGERSYNEKYTDRFKDKIHR